METKPFRPIGRTDLPSPRLTGEFKLDPAEFEVDELPLYEPCGSGDHVWVRIEKRGIGTMPMTELVARALGRRARDVGYAGLKDAQAVTRQWISLEHVDETAVAALQLDGIRVLEVRRHRNKLKLGHLAGNRFAIVVRGLGAVHAPDIARNLGDLARRGVANYFGEQRFGKRGANLDKGLRILRGDPRRAARSMPKRLLGLLVSAVQSDVFNRVVASRIDALDRLRAGDVAFLHANGACFRVEDPTQEQYRCDAFEISPSGPLPGPKMLRASRDVGATEDRALAELGLSYEAFGQVPFGVNEGARRPLRVRVGSPTVTVAEHGLRLTFDLPKGSFATAVLRELLTDVPWFG